MQFAASENRWICQPSITSLNREGLTAGFNTPISMTIGGGKFLLADQNNHRILIWNSVPSSTFTPPDLVLGQANFKLSLANQGLLDPTEDTVSVPYGIATDGTKLAVVDSNNHRVLLWNSFPTINNQSPDLVLGQPDFFGKTANNGGRSAQTFNVPRDVVWDGTRLFVSDQNNHRVLVWNSWPTVNQAPADFALGQSTLSGGSANSGPNTVACGSASGRNACSFSAPIGIYSDGTRFFVADSANHRVLVWSSIPTTQQQAAQLVIGQPTLLVGTVNNGPNNASCDNVLGLNRCSLSSPQDIYTSGTSVFVADVNNNRVLEYVNLTANQPSAVRVLGQPSFTTGTANSGGVSAQSLSSPMGLTGTGSKLFVADRFNHRVLAWSTLPSSDQQAADFVLGQKYFNYSISRYKELTATHLELNAPHGVLVVNNRLIVADRSNNRILIWNSIPTQNNQTPNVVLGQPDFVSNQRNNGPASAGCGSAGRNACSLNAVIHISSDGTRLIAVDRENNRVLIWNNIPTVSQTPADIVLGQPDFTSSTANNGPNTVACGSSLGINQCSLSNPIAAETDGTRLIVTDQDNNRILIWTSFPTSNQQAANLVLGQPSFITNSANNGPATAACGGVSGLNQCSIRSPYLAKIKGEKLLVSDASNNRVLIWNSFPTTNQQPADLVLGQANFISGGFNAGGMNASAIYQPMGMDFFGEQLFVVDRSNQRLLKWSTLPTASATGADLLFGQFDFVSRIAYTEPSSISLLDPTYMGIGNGFLAISEEVGNRVTVRAIDVDFGL